jgi:hypothetical protein
MKGYTVLQCGGSWTQVDVVKMVYEVMGMDQRIESVGRRVVLSNSGNNCRFEDENGEDQHH